VPRHERHPAASYLADHQRIAGDPERGVELYLVNGVEELIQPRAADNSDAGQVGHGDQATFEPDDDVEPEEDGDLDEEPLPTASPDFLSLLPELSPEEESALEVLSDFFPSDPLADAAAGSAPFWPLRLSFR